MEGLSKMLKIIIADDDPYARAFLRGVIEEFQGSTIIGEAGTGRELVQLVDQLQPDIIFVDVEMPEMNGIDAVKEILQLYPKIFVIFATAYRDYCHEAFQVYADYLLKPFDSERIVKTLKRIQDLKEEGKSELMARPQKLGREENSKLFIQSNEKLNIVNIKDIILITRTGRKTIIHTTDDKVATYEPLTKIEEKLKSGSFFRCHKGYLINANMVLEIIPSGNKTYLVKMANTKDMVLMTSDKLIEFQEKYCI